MPNAPHPEAMALMIAYYERAVGGVPGAKSEAKIDDQLAGQTEAGGLCRRAVLPLARHGRRTCRQMCEKAVEGSGSFVQGKGHLPSVGAAAPGDGQLSRGEGSAED